MLEAGSLRVLVVYKKSQMELYDEHEPGRIEEIRRSEPRMYQRFLSAHEDNSRAIESVARQIEARGMIADLQYRAEHERTEDACLVVSVGGDGTLLDVSHAVLSAPLMGVNSAPGSSVGHFCATNAEDFGDTLDRWRNGKLGSARLTRLQATINGRALPLPILNDILFAHTVPAAMSRYVLRIGDVEEEHKSSGIWISSAAGSTAAIRSAGGVEMDPTDERVQYVVREPYLWAGQEHRLLGGIETKPIEMLVKMRTAGLYLDGHREQHTVSLGDRITVARHPRPLELVGFKRGG